MNLIYLAKFDASTINLHLIAVFWLNYAILIPGPQEGPGNGRD
jgi:hypothetical protein